MYIYIVYVYIHIIYIYSNIVFAQGVLIFFIIIFMTLTHKSLMLFKCKFYMCSMIIEA